MAWEAQGARGLPEQAMKDFFPRATELPAAPGTISRPANDGFHAILLLGCGCVPRGFGPALQLHEFDRCFDCSPDAAGAFYPREVCVWQTRVLHALQAYIAALRRRAPRCCARSPAAAQLCMTRRAAPPAQLLPGGRRTRTEKPAAENALLQ